MKILALLLASINDANVRAIISNTMKLTTVKRTRWEKIWKWFVSKAKWIIMRAVSVFPEATRAYSIYEAGKNITEYNSKRVDVMFEDVLNAVLINWDAINKEYKIEDGLKEVAINWKELKNQFKTKKASKAGLSITDLKKLGLNTRTLKSTIISGIDLLKQTDSKTSAKAIELLEKIKPYAVSPVNE